MSEQAINLKRIERSLAYEMSSSMIESSCARVERDGDYYDLYDLDDVDEAVGDLSEEAGYLESRGLLVRQPDKPNHVEILDECAATEAERLKDEHEARVQELAFYFADRLAADAVEVSVPSEFLADLPEEPDDPDAPGRYWHDNSRAMDSLDDYVEHYSIDPLRAEEMRAESLAERSRAWEYLTARGLLEIHPVRPELFRTRALGPEMAVSV
jgi:hypothetical protein